MHAADPAPASALTVLVADDIENSRLEVVQLVQSLGHRCLVCARGHDVLALAAQADIVLLDLLMPDLSGFAVAQQLRAQVTERWLPVIVTSSLQGEEHFIHALSEGADDYLPRPVNPGLLQAKLRHYQRVLGLQARLVGLAQRQQAIHEHIADAVVTVDAQGTIAEANRAAKCQLGGSAETELVGQSLQQVLGFALAELGQRREITLPQGGGHTLSLGISASHWSMGSQTYTTLALHDLSEQRRMERMKDEFLATVSHELRTPLTSIIGALGLVASGVAGALPPAALNLAQVAQRNGERLSRLIDDVLDLTKLEGNRMVLQLRAARLDQLVAEAVSANQSYAQRNQVTLQFEAVAQSPQALIDADRFLQVMANLLSNAIKHSRAGQAVQVRLYGVPEGWRIDVVDQGSGIDPAFQARLFDKFAQADSSDRRAVGGTGLGLYVSRMLVERMQGRIFAQSVLGAGSTFSVVLPAREPSQRWLLCLARDHQRQERLREWLGDLLQVETAGDVPGAQALLARLGPPCAVVADPQDQGPSDLLCAQLRRWQKPGAIVLTGDSIDAAFAAQQGLAWITPVPREGRQAMVDFVQARLQAQAQKD